MLRQFVRFATELIFLTLILGAIVVGAVTLSVLLGGQ